MEKFYVISILSLVFTSLGFGFWVYKSHQFFPIVINAKVIRVEKDTESGKWRCYFQAHQNETKVMRDESTYQEGVYKVHDNVSVHMNRTGTRCISNMSVMPMIIAISAFLMALVLGIAYYGETQRQANQLRAGENVVSGSYIQTGSNTVFMRDNNIAYCET